MKKNSVRALTEGAIMVAAAQILGYLVLYRLPWGGSICLAMLPIMIYSHRWGVKNGLLAGLVFGLLQYVGDNGIAISWVSMLGDYLVAFGVLGLSGVCHGKKNGLFVGSLVGGLARFAVHYVVGATVWGEYMPDTFFGMTMTTPWFYSLLYNGSYMLPSIALCLLVEGLLWKPMNRYLTGADLAA